MTDLHPNSPTSSESHVPPIDATDPLPDREKPRKRRDRTPVDRRLPRPLLQELQQLIHRCEKISWKLVCDLDARFQIEARYAVSPRRLANYLRRIHAGRPAESPPDAADQVSARSDAFREALTAHRRRQASVAAILDRTFGRFARSNPQLWDRRAYLMLVGLVYERLATSEEELSTDELMSLSKVLTDNRRAEAQSKKSEHSAPPAEDETAPSADLPGNFTEIVRRVYGTNFQLTTPTTAEQRPGGIRDGKEGGVGG